MLSSLQCEQWLQTHTQQTPPPPAPRQIRASVALRKRRVNMLLPPFSSSSHRHLHLLPLLPPPPPHCFAIFHPPEVKRSPVNASRLRLFGSSGNERFFLFLVAQSAIFVSVASASACMAFGRLCPCQRFAFSHSDLIPDVFAPGNVSASFPAFRGDGSLDVFINASSVFSLCPAWFHHFIMNLRAPEAPLMSVTVMRTRLYKQTLEPQIKLNK